MDVVVESFVTCVIVGGVEGGNGTVVSNYCIKKERFRFSHKETL